MQSRNRKIFFSLYLLFIAGAATFSIFRLTHMTEDPREGELVDLHAIDPRIKIDLKYATSDNFTHQIVYDFHRCLIIRKAALRLKEVQDELEQRGLSLKVWDGYRPISAQWRFWEILPDTRYVSDPRKGGRHTRGTAVDVTLVTKEGGDLPMPTPFDQFNAEAHRDFRGCSEEAQKNRQLLETVMEKHGFVGFPTEWWHFDYVDWEQYPPRDVDVRSYCDHS